MGLLGPLARLLGIETDVLLKQLRENAIALGAIGVFAAICVVFLLVAANTALTLQVGPVYAPLIIAGAALLIALVLFVVERMRKRALQRRAAEAARQNEATALVASAAMAALPDLLSNSAIRNIGLPLALYAGFMLVTSKRGTKPPRGPLT